MTDYVPALMSICVLSLSLQKPFHFVDNKKDLFVEARDAKLDATNPKSNLFILRGHVDIVSKSQGLHMNAETARCETQTDKGGRTELKHAHAEGGVHLVKEVSTNGAKQTTDVTSSTGDLITETTGDVVKLTGPVRIASLSTAKKQTMVATGSSGTVILAHGNENQSGNGLRSGTLEGPVKVILDSAAKSDKGAPSHVVATGDRMEISNGEAPTITMIGNVEIHGQSIGDVTGLSRATLQLNKAWEVTHWDGGSGVADLGLHREIHLKNFTETSADPTSGVTQVKGAGSPVSVADDLLGVRMEADQMDCTLTTDPAGNASIKHAVLDGHAQIWYDSESALAAQRKLTPAAIGSADGRTERVHLASEHIDFVRDGSAANVTMTKSADATDEATGNAVKSISGKSIPVRFSQTLHTTGSGGTFDFIVPNTPDPKSADPKSIHLDGPVQFQMRREESPLSGPVKIQTTSLDGHGDTLDGDFTAVPESVLTLTGNVLVDTKMPGYNSTSTGSKGTVYLDSLSREPKRFVFQGTPSKTTVNSTAPLGGAAH